MSISSNAWCGVGRGGVGWAVVKRRRVDETSGKVYALLLNYEYIPLAGRPRRGGRFPAVIMASWQHRWRGARRPAAGASDERHASADDQVP